MTFKLKRLNESANVICPDCGEDYGKASEYGSHHLRYCANCGYGRDSKGHHGSHEHNSSEPKPTASELKSLLHSHTKRVEELKDLNFAGAPIESLNKFRKDPVNYPLHGIVSKPTKKGNEYHSKITFYHAASTSTPELRQKYTRHVVSSIDKNGKHKHAEEYERGEPKRIPKKQMKTFKEFKEHALEVKERLK